MAGVNYPGGEGQKPIVKCKAFQLPLPNKAEMSKSCSLDDNI